MIYQEGYVYHIKDEYFEKVQDNNLMQNKEGGTYLPTYKRTCKVCDLSSPLLYHGAVGCVRSVKDCPTAYRLRLVP
ncbi:hypothetical protein F100043J3_38210 [Mediterraneibacter gnavus]